MKKSHRSRLPRKVVTIRPKFNVQRPYCLEIDNDTNVICCKYIQCKVKTKMKNHNTVQVQIYNGSEFTCSIFNKRLRKKSYDNLKAQSFRLVVHPCNSCMES